MKQPRSALCNHASFGIPTSTKRQKYPLPNGTHSWTAAMMNSKHFFKTTFTMELPLWTVSLPQLRPQRRLSKESVLSGKIFVLWSTLRPNITDWKRLWLSSWHILCVLSFDKGDYLWKDVVFHLGPVERRHCLHTDGPRPPHGHVLLSWAMWVSSSRSGSVASQTLQHLNYLLESTLPSFGMQDPGFPLPQAWWDRGQDSACGWLLRCWNRPRAVPRKLWASVTRAHQARVPGENRSPPQPHGGH